MATTTTRPMCKGLLTGKHSGDICPNYSGGLFFEHFCHRHTSKKRVQPDPETCAVCFEDMPVEYRTGCCKRVFCKDCLTKHQKAGGTACPNCRAPMGYALESVEYQWMNLRYHATKLSKRVKETEYLKSKEALSTHILALMDKQKAEALEEIKKEYDERVKEIEEGHAQHSAAWINNTDNYRDDFWKDAENVRHTVSNLSLLRSSRFPSHAMADAGMRLVKEANETIENVLECEDIMGIIYADDDEMQEIANVIRQRLEGTEEDAEDEEEDSDYEEEEDEEEDTCSGSSGSQWEDVNS